MEIWKSVNGYETLYQVSNLGNVKGIISGKILRPSADRFGYQRVMLCKDGKAKQYMVHRLVADAFIPNPNGYPCVNHKDEIKYNNKLSNLEWCTYSYNNSYNGRARKVADARSKRVMCIELKTIFNSIAEASRITKESAGNICSCCKGNMKSCNGYHWEYSN